MRLDFSPHFQRQYEKAPVPVRRAFDKHSSFLLQGLGHPSLHAKKYDEARDIWQARVNYGWRFYFKIVGDTYRMEEIKLTTTDSARRGKLGRLVGFGRQRCLRTREFRYLRSTTNP